MARKRRGRGEGGIFQRADGLWVASVSAGFDAQGKRRRRTVYGHSKSEVQQKLRALQGGEALLGSADKLSVEQYLNHWLAGVKPTVEPNTYGPYERHVRLHLAPYLGGVKLATLRPMHVKELYSRLAAKGMSAAMQRKVGTTLTIALGEAVEEELIDYNPAVGVRKPKASKPDIQVLDPDQVHAFLKSAEADRLFALYVMALDSGMRPGELFALAWSDLSLEGGYVVVTKSLERIGDKARVKEVKTKRGRRRIDLSEHTIGVLREHQRRMLAEGNIGAPVFCNTCGGYVRISDLHKGSFKPIFARANASAVAEAEKQGTTPAMLPAIRLYDLRHTCATLLLLAGENPKVVSERLGHATVQLTLDTYSHVLPTMQKRAAEKMNALLRPTAPQAGVS
jgi:integrase